MSSNRYIKEFKKETFVEECNPGTMARNEVDSNADTCCLGNNLIVISYTNQTADIYLYDEFCVQIINVPIVSGVTTYHHPNGNSCILIVNEELYYGKKLSPS